MALPMAGAPVTVTPSIETLPLVIGTVAIGPTSASMAGIGAALAWLAINAVATLRIAVRESARIWESPWAV